MTNMNGEQKKKREKERERVEMLGKGGCACG